MIVRMAQVEVLGPKGRLLEALAALRELGVVQLDRAAGESAPPMHALHPDAASLEQRLALEQLRADLAELCACLPAVPVRPSYLDPAAAVEAARHLLPGHRARCRAWREDLERLRDEARQAGRQADLLATLGKLLHDLRLPSGLVEVFGVVLREPDLLEHVAREAERLACGRFVVSSAVAPDGTVVGVLATERSCAGPLRELLGSAQIAELEIPTELRALEPARQAALLHERAAERQRRIADLEQDLQRFAGRWLPLYRRVQQWLAERLALIAATAEVLETELCFCLRGWMPAAAFAEVQSALDARCGGEVLLQQQELRDSDLARVPVSLHNPPYFRPFELFARLLPLPRYASFDPTPFLALFMPLFFGMMLGDLGYGAVLLVTALVLRARARRPGNLHDAALILLVCAIYTMIFGLLFGECFGEEVAHRLGLTPLLLQRSTALLPLLWFALAVGSIHIALGLILGALTSFRQGEKREAALRLLQLLTLGGLALWVVTLALPTPPVSATPALAVLGVTVPLLLLLGGLLAPLEMLKTVGNVVSYARIMAIGLTSVLLAQVANRLGGLTGDVLAGALVAGLLHLFNLLLGIFAPTVHALRLHYVEFFGKFLEAGGRSFEPLSKDGGE